MIRAHHLLLRVAVSLRTKTTASCWNRGYRVLAIESSCDDSCLALLERDENRITVSDEMKRTLNSQKFGGIVPTQAHEFHQVHIASMVEEFGARNDFFSRPPDLICCTRGPGMLGSLSASLQVAKGLAIAWNKPMVGVHHMLGHILVLRLENLGPKYPFLSLLASGGHTMLVLLKSISEHEVIINTIDIAVGDSLDKCAREIGIQGNLLGKEMEAFVDAIPADVKQQFDSVSTVSRSNEFGFKLRLPLRGPHHQAIPNKIEYSFAPFLSSIKDHLSRGPLDSRAKQFLAYKTQQMMFRHIIDRVNIALMKHGVGLSKVEGDGKFAGVRDFVFSGGVASNQTFRRHLEQELRADLVVGNGEFDFHFPKVSLCTDNAVMIGVAGVEIYEQLGVRTDMSVLPIRKWPLGDLLAVDGWVKHKV